MSSAAPPPSAPTADKKASTIWDKLKRYLLNLFNIMVFLGCVTSTTGSFTALPDLLANISFLAAHPWVIKSICALAGVSGFTAFLGTYKEVMTAAAYRATDYLRYYCELSLYFFKKFKHSLKKQDSANSLASKPQLKRTLTPLECLKQEIKDLETKKKNLSEKNKQLINKLHGSQRGSEHRSPDGDLWKYETNGYLKKVSENTLEKWRSTLTDSYNYYYPTETAIPSTSPLPVVDCSNKPSEQSTPPRHTNKFTKLCWSVYSNACHIIKQSSFGFLKFIIALGTIVVLAMSILTATKTAVLFGIAITPPIYAFCIVLALSKTICQLFQSGDKQYDVLLGFIRLGKTEEQSLEDRKTLLESSVKKKEETNQELLAIKQQLKEAKKETLDEREAKEAIKNKAELAKSEIENICLTYLLKLHTIYYGSPNYFDKPEEPTMPLETSPASPAF